MPRKATNLFSTTRGRVRASMNKVNLFNMYKKSPVSYQGMTLYQQKWRAKQETRAYHSEHLKESRWKTLFNPKLESVAQLDASLKGVEVANTPLVLQTYAVLEKRLETALFRAMFASSVRQARQFIKSGDVFVNGVTIRHPAFPLKSGDVFHVNPERVMYALGRSKPSIKEAVKVDNAQASAWNRYVDNVRKDPKAMWDLKLAKPPSLNPLAAHERQSSLKLRNESIHGSMLASQRSTTREAVLSRLLSAAAGKYVDAISTASFSDVVSGSSTDMEKCLAAYKLLKDAGHELVGAHSLEKCTAFVHTKSSGFKTPEEAKLAARVRKILAEIVSLQVERMRIASVETQIAADPKQAVYDAKWGEKLIKLPLNDLQTVAADEGKAVKFLWQPHLFGRKDPSKKYFTPWTPKGFLGAFAILPHHLEISFDTCHAVYLNDPVSRPGHSEVITPFPEDVHERAYMYYVRKGL